MITFKTKFSITVGTCWYTTETDGRRADLIHYRHLPEPIEGAIREEFVTLWIDLTKDEDQLLAEMNKSTRHHVRKAGEYGLVYESWYPDTGEKLDEFCEFFDASASAKALPLVDRKDIRAYAAEGALDLRGSRLRTARPWYGTDTTGMRATRARPTRPPFSGRNPIPRSGICWAREPLPLLGRYAAIQARGYPAL